MSNSNFEIKLYECVSNLGLGLSHLLMKKKDKNNCDIFLFFVETNREHFVICDAIDGTKDGCSFINAQYYSSLEEALKDYKLA